MLRASFPPSSMFTSELYLKFLVAENNVTNEGPGYIYILISWSLRLRKASSRLVSESAISKYVRLKIFKNEIV